jgi:glycerophosphoryl diester phosphodiesterase
VAGEQPDRLREHRKLAVEQVEFDVHPTRDGKLVVIHDDTLDRTTDGRGPVAVQDWSTLSKLVLKGTGGQRYAAARRGDRDLPADADRAAPRDQVRSRSRALSRHAARVAEAIGRRRCSSAASLPASSSIRCARPRRRHARSIMSGWCCRKVQIDIGLANVIASAKTAGVPTLGLRRTC